MQNVKECKNNYDDVRSNSLCDDCSRMPGRRPDRYSHRRTCRAGIGQLAGGDSEATLIGAAVGAGAGYIFGNESDKEKTQNQLYAVNDRVNSQIVNVTNSNGSIVQVRLRRQGVGWVGTRREYYPTLPTAEQLRPVYGF